MSKTKKMIRTEIERLEAVKADLLLQYEKQVPFQDVHFLYIIITARILALKWVLGWEE